MTPPAYDTLLDRRDLINRWNCSLATIKRREAAKSLSPIRIGKRIVRYRLSDILAFEESCTSKAAP